VIARRLSLNAAATPSVAPGRPVDTAAAAAITRDLTAHGFSGTMASALIADAAAHGSALAREHNLRAGARAELVRRLAPDGELIAYGHVGDGNLHFNVSQRTGADPATFLARKSQLESAIFDLAGSLSGSFSAEHGIGRLKAAELARRADPVEYSVMRTLKRALDPKGILNPGKVLT